MGVQVEARGHKRADYALGLLYDASINMTSANQYSCREASRVNTRSCVYCERHESGTASYWAHDALEGTVNLVSDLAASRGT